MKADGLHSDACGVTSNLGFKLAHPPPGEEIVVSGLAGKFPSSNDAYQFRENLFNKVDLVMEDARRLTTFHDDVPQRSGIVNEIEKFDAGCFGIRSCEAQCLDPLSRLISEKAVEAIIDAGINPTTLAGTS